MTKKVESGAPSDTRKDANDQVNAAALEQSGTTQKVELGAPSITGKDANDLVAAAFAEAKYPMKVLVTNHAPRSVVFPEVPGLFLAHCASATGSTAMAEIASAGQLQRLASSVEQIAELNGYAVFISIAEIEPAVAAKTKTTAPVAT